MKTPKLFCKSKRFDLRPYQAEDYAAWKAAHLNAFAKQNEFDQEKKTAAELTKAEFKKFLAKNEKYRKEESIYYFGVFERKTGRLMGYVLFAMVARFNVQSARISYVVFNNYWKHGYGKEMVDAAVGFAFRSLKLHRLEAEIQPHNRASIGLALGLGFQYEGVRRGAVYFNRKWHDHAIYALLAEDRGVRNPRPSVFR
ncbi:MAG: N-acetyltransferase [Proteobacteria bacterium]|nr:MAG: N-acetyltransferase [Pseudomonadota bacterium]